MAWLEEAAARWPGSIGSGPGGESESGTEASVDFVSVSRSPRTGLLPVVPGSMLSVTNSIVVFGPKI